MPETTPKRWTRTRIIWLLIVLSLVPGLLAAAFRDRWEQLPEEIRGGMLAISGILMLAVLYLILANTCGCPRRIRNVGWVTIEPDRC